MTMLKFEKFSSTSHREPVGGITRGGYLVIRKRGTDKSSLVHSTGNVLFYSWEEIKIEIETFIYEDEQVVITF